MDRGVETALLGWPPDGPTLGLDYRRFSYAGKFVMSTTGKAVVRDTGGERADYESELDDDDDILAAVAFNADRTDPETLWIRYVTVREDRRGEGFGPKLCRFVADQAGNRGHERLSIAVNNPFAYEALYRAGFAFTGRETGLAELVLSRPTDGIAADRSMETYQAGLDRYRERETSSDERRFLDRTQGTEPPHSEDI